MGRTSRTWRVLKVSCVAVAVIGGVNAPVTAHAAPRPQAITDLTWSQPELSSPTVLPVTQGNRDFNLPTDRDFILMMPDVALTGRNGLRVNGGRNVVLVGGAISVAGLPYSTPGNDRRGLVLKNQTGTVHIEGLQISGGDLAEGIQIASPKAIVQLQNIRITRVSSDGDPWFHSDVLQVWGGVRELRVDGLTGSTDFQGIFLKSDVPGAEIGPVDLRRVNIVGGSGYMFFAEDTGPINTSYVYGQASTSKEWQYAMFPRPSSGVWREVNSGVPSAGPYVPQGAVGPDYGDSWQGSPSNASVASVGVDEPGNSWESSWVEVKVTLDKPAGAKIFIDYSLQDNSTHPSDYVGGDGTIVFDPGQTSKSIWLKINHDDWDEGTETLEVVLDEVKNAWGNGRRGTVWINED